MDISLKIRGLQKNKNITQKELSEKIGISVKGLQKALANKDFKVSILIKIAEVLGVPVSYFFEGGENNTNDIDKELLRIFKRKVNLDIVAFESLATIRKSKPKTEEEVVERFILISKYASYVHLEKDEIKYLYDNNIITTDFYNELKTLYKGRYKK